MLVRVRWLWRRRKNSGFFSEYLGTFGNPSARLPKRPQTTSVTDADLDVFWSTSGSRGVLGALSGQPPKCLQDVPRLGATSGGILGVPARFRTTFASFPFCEWRQSRGCSAGCNGTAGRRTFVTTHRWGCHDDIHTAKYVLAQKPPGSETVITPLKRPPVGFVRGWISVSSLKGAKVASLPTGIRNWVGAKLLLHRTTQPLRLLARE